MIAWQFFKVDLDGFTVTRVLIGYPLKNLEKIVHLRIYINIYTYIIIYKIYPYMLIYPFYCKITVWYKKNNNNNEKTKNN